MLLGVWDGLMPDAAAALTSSTKLGGRPVYTYPLPPQIESEITNRLAKCASCGDPMFLVLQSFSPLPNGNEQYNRMKYVYACNSAVCSTKESGSWRAFSITFSTHDAAAEDADNESEDSGEEPAFPATLPPFMYAAARLDFIDEPEEKATVLSRKEEMVLAVYERRVLAQKRAEAAKARGEEPDSDDEREAAKLVGDEDVQELEREIDLRNNDVDVAFEAFRSRLARAPHQVLRYQPGSRPLYMNPAKMASSSASPCPRCQGPQVMEFQLMPTLLYLLRVPQFVNRPTKAATDDGMDFATVTVMRCKNSQCGCSTEEELFSASAQPHRLVASCGPDVLDEDGQPVQCLLEVDSVLVEAAPTMDDEHGSPGIDTRPTLRDFFQGSPEANSSEQPQPVEAASTADQIHLK